MSEWRSASLHAFLTLLSAPHNQAGIWITQITVICFYPWLWGRAVCGPFLTNSTAESLPDKSVIWNMFCIKAIDICLQGVRPLPSHTVRPCQMHREAGTDCPVSPLAWFKLLSLGAKQALWSTKKKMLSKTPSRCSSWYRGHISYMWPTSGVTSCKFDRIAQSVMQRPQWHWHISPYAKMPNFVNGRWHW